MNNIFNNLNKINVNEHTEKRNELTYLSWSWAWAELKKQYPTACYKIERFGEDKKPYLYDEDLGYMVFTSITIKDLTHEMWLPVMDSANKAMKNREYSYLVKNPSFKYAKRCSDGVFRDNYGNEQRPYLEKKVQRATMFDINKTIMRCLTKNISMFGLGLYIYSGEDLPEEEKKVEVEPVNEKPTQTIEVKTQVQKATQEQIEKLQLYFNIDAIHNKYIDDCMKKAKIEHINQFTYSQAEKILEEFKKAEVKANENN